MYEQGKVFVKCLSECPIFVQSRNGNYETSQIESTVWKISANHSSRVKIFDGFKFSQQLTESAKYGYQHVYDMVDVCKIKISFGKGFGNDYFRQDITYTPCWIEIRLNCHLQWVDKVLKQMKPQDPITSNS